MPAWALVRLGVRVSMPDLGRVGGLLSPGPASLAGSGTESVGRAPRPLAVLPVALH